MVKVHFITFRLFRVIFQNFSIRVCMRSCLKWKRFNCLDDRNQRNEVLMGMSIEHEQLHEHDLMHFDFVCAHLAAEKSYADTNGIVSITFSSHVSRILYVWMKNRNCLNRNRHVVYLPQSIRHLRHGHKVKIVLLIRFFGIHCATSLSINNWFHNHLFIYC